MHSSTFLAVPCLAATLLLTGCTSGSAPDSSSAPTTSAPSPSATINRTGIERSLRDLEEQYDATVGVVATDTASGQSVSYNGDHRFGYASTLKALAAAQFLRSVHGADRDERVRWTEGDIAAAGYSPVTEQHINNGLTYAELAEAAVRKSDNTALNLVLQKIGGPSGLDDALTELGDTTTEVVHLEPELNTIEPGSTDDTTTPAAFTADLATFLNGHTLDKADTATLLDWMGGNATGDTLIRAGAPAGWTVADKSGGAGGIRNDVAWVTRPDGDPVVISVLSTRNNPDAAYDDALVAKSASVVLAAFDAH